MRISDWSSDVCSSDLVAKVIASSIRKGNVLDIGGSLYTVLSAESFFPGKGTPTTQIDMRRLSDGIKTSQRYRTTEQVERAFVEEQAFSYLYQDGDDYVFMNPERRSEERRGGKECVRTGRSRWAAELE